MRCKPYRGIEVNVNTDGWFSAVINGGEDRLKCGSMETLKREIRRRTYEMTDGLDGIKVCWLATWDRLFHTGTLTGLVKKGPGPRIILQIREDLRGSPRTIWKTPESVRMIPADDVKKLNVAIHRAEEEINKTNAAYGSYRSITDILTEKIK